MSGPRKSNKVDPEDYDRVEYEPDSGLTFYGKDVGNGRTDWYDEDGNLDTATDTPEYDDEYQHRIPHSGDDYDD